MSYFLLMIFLHSSEQAEAAVHIYNTASRIFTCLSPGNRPNRMCILFTTNPTLHGFGWSKVMEKPCTLIHIKQFTAEIFVLIVAMVINSFGNININQEYYKYFSYTITKLKGTFQTLWGEFIKFCVPVFFHKKVKHFCPSLICAKGDRLILASGRSTPSTSTILQG